MMSLSDHTKIKLAEAMGQLNAAARAIDTARGLVDDSGLAQAYPYFKAQLDDELWERRDSVRFLQRRVDWALRGFPEGEEPERCPT